MMLRTIILTRPIIILERMERPTNVVFDLRQRLTSGSRRARIDSDAVAIQEPFRNVDADGRVGRRRIDYERRIELHLQA